MTALYLSLNGQRITSGEVRIPFSGVWVADLDVDAETPITGAATIVLGGLTLRGTVDPNESTVFGLRQTVRVLGGAGSWGRELAPKSYHNDAGVKRSTVLQDAAREAGETLSLAADVEGRIGADYQRHRGPASQVFAHVAPGAVWWVDAAGVTQVATARPSVERSAKADLEVLDAGDTVELAGAPEAVAIGTVLRDTRLEAPFTVRELCYRIEEEKLRIYAFDRATKAGGRLYEAVRGLVEDVLRETLPGLYRYRVVATVGDRVNLQAVSKGRHPNVLPASLGAGIAGGWADLAGGAEVLVGFEDGSPTRPVVVSYTPRGREGHVPSIAALDGDSVELGDAEAAVHRVGDKSTGPVITAASSVITITNPDGSTVILTDGSGVSQWTTTGTAAPPGQLLAEAAEGSPKVLA